MSKPLLEVESLVMNYSTTKGDVSAVEDVTFTLHQGEALGLVGESGCGKTSVAMSLLQLQAENAVFKGGEIRLGGVLVATVCSSRAATPRRVHGGPVRSDRRARRPRHVRSLRTCPRPD